MNGIRRVLNEPCPDCGILLTLDGPEPTATVTATSSTDAYVRCLGCRPLISKGREHHTIPPLSARDRELLAQHERPLRHYAVSIQNGAGWLALVIDKATGQRRVGPTHFKTSAEAYTAAQDWAKRLTPDYRSRNGEGVWSRSRLHQKSTESLR
jgi:hypothetical protein